MQDVHSQGFSGFSVFRYPAMGLRGEEFGRFALAQFLFLGKRHPVSYHFVPNRGHSGNVARGVGVHGNGRPHVFLHAGSFRSCKKV